MTFAEIYQRVLPLWPAAIDTSDAIVIEPKPNRNKTQMLKIGSGSGFFSQHLSTAWTKAEDALTEGDAFGKLMIWSMYQLLQRRAEKLDASEEKVLQPAQLNPTELEEQFFNNLHDEGWEEELAQYERKTE